MIKGVTIRQLYNKGVEELGQTFNLFSGLLPDDEKSAIKYIAEYEKKPKLYDMYFLDNYGEIAYSLIRPLSDISIEDFQWRVSAWQLMNKYKLNKLYDASLLTYKPLDNYSEHTERAIEGSISDVQNGSETNGTEYGGVMTRTGTETNTAEKGVTETTNGNIEHSIAGSEKTEKSGLIGSTTVKSVNPSDDSNFVDSEKETISGGNGVEQMATSYTGRVNTDKYNDYRTQQTGKNTDTLTYGDVKDTHSGTDTTTHRVDNMTTEKTWKGYKETENMHGCSRGDTSQHLLTEERAVANWSFWNELYLDFLKNLTTNTYIERRC